MPSIAELLLAQGQQAAETRRRLGEIQGQMLGNIGSTIAAIPGQVQQAQAASRRAELENMQLADARSRQAGEAVLDRAMQPYQPNGPQEEGAPPAQAQQPYLTANHRWDVPALGEVLAARGMGHLAPDLLSSAEKMNAAFDAHDAAQQKLADANTILWGRLAGGFEAAKKAGVPDEAAFDLIVKPAVSGGKLSQQQADQMKTQLMALPPDQRDVQISGMIDAADKVGPKETLAQGAEQVGMSGRVLARNAPKPNIQKATFSLKQTDGTIGPAMEGFFDENANAGRGAYLIKKSDGTYEDVSDRVMKAPTGTEPASQGLPARVKDENGPGWTDTQIERLPGRRPEDLGGYYIKRADGTVRSLVSGVDFKLIPAPSLTGPPPASQNVPARVKQDDGTWLDMQIERVPGRSAADPGHYMLPRPGLPPKELFPGVDFRLVPTGPERVIEKEDAAVAKIPEFAKVPERPSAGPESNQIDPVIGVSPNGLWQDAMGWLYAHRVPPQGLGNTPMSVAWRKAVDTKIGAISAAVGIDQPVMEKLFQVNAASLQKQQQNYDNSSISINKADLDLAALEKILPKIGDVGSPLFNRPIRAFEKELAGNPDLSEFSTRLNSVQSEYTRLIQSGSAANANNAITDSARREMQKLIADNATVGQIIRSARALRSEGVNRMISQVQQLKITLDRLQGNIVGGPTPAPPKGRSKRLVNGVWVDQ